MQRKLYFILILLLVINKSHTQETENTKVYEIRNSVAVYPCDINGKNFYSDNRFHNPPIYAKFVMVKPANRNNDTVIIRYLLWNKKKDSSLRKYYNDPWISSKWDAGKSKPADSLAAKNNPPGSQNWDSRDARTNTGDSSNTSSSNEDYDNKIDKFFKIDRYDLDSNCVKVYTRGIRSTAFTIGLVTMPLKLRLGKNFDFQGNLSLGSTAGIKMRLSKYNSNFVNVLLGTSISTISLDSFSTKGKLVGQPMTNIAVFSPSFGLVFEFGKAQAGIFYGWDILNKSTQSKYEWIYNKRPWLSIGFGFSILNIDSKSNNEQSQNQ